MLAIQLLLWGMVLFYFSNFLFMVYCSFVTYQNWKRRRKAASAAQDEVNRNPSLWA